MDTTSCFVNLLNKQSFDDLDSPEPAWFSTTPSSDQFAVKERRKWSPIEDKILIGAWLNTSKDPVVSNEQKVGAFWKRIQYGLRKQRSGQNDDDVMKAALDIFYNDYSIKFKLEHAWRELRHDKKWCSTFLAKDTVKEKRKQTVEVDGEDEVGAAEPRPMGVKASKAASKRKKSGREEELEKLQGILEKKDKISKQKVLERLLAKNDPLSEMETSLKLKLVQYKVSVFSTTDAFGVVKVFCS
ncbi:PREDICTED: glutathione S-transferase T2-like [Brassica oleracea var. oleracea]|uniref:No apical meristem-associated C-terminal domain-containing protein n=1 Tax=Brassica oleracea var. oleracea TaxID=109376 RepID=A0A0D3C471_BRAOL|nr:PREDICTED: glutathione S-transferase T2-like [Brassica oleracea var. oleracea]